jgi:hypothetical protein
MQHPEVLRERADAHAYRFAELDFPSGGASMRTSAHERARACPGTNP